MSRKSLIAWIESHGHRAVPFHGKIMAFCAASFKGEPITMIDILESDLNTVQNWLGY